MLNDVAGKPIRTWDSRGHNFVTKYDALRRPVGQYVRGTTAASDPRTLNLNILVDKIEYGEPPANASQADLDRALRLNLRTRIYRHFDSAGVAANAQLDTNGNPTAAYDFKGNVLRSTRKLVSDYQNIPDWSSVPQPPLDDETFTSSTRYDALNRPVQSIAPHSSLTHAQHPNKINVIQPVFNEANLLERVDVWLERAAEPASLLDPSNVAASPVGVSNIDYDAKGQRERIDYKNGASTAYRYDPLTFRLTRLRTTRAANMNGLASQLFQNNGTVQDLHYTYDPAGNITEITDHALKKVFHNQEQIDPVCRYVYDAIYRLIEGRGREHIGQSALLLNPPNGNYHDHPYAGGTQLSDPQAVRNYTEQYVYDPVGNFDGMIHRVTNGTWTRSYSYQEASLIEPTKQSNRLSSTSIGAIPENYSSNGDGYDAHGNMLHMPHLQQMRWDYKDQLREVNLGGGGTAYYVYDASGQRVRKVCEKSLGLTEERIYLGGFEIFRRHGGAIGANTATLERETLHIMDDKQRIALVETRTLGSDPAPQQLIRYQFGNHLGSASLELDEQTQIISYEEYTPYGSSSYQAAHSQTETAKRYRYTGKERDEESGLSYHSARYYVAWLGRWTSCDPAGMLDGLNLYVYTKGNPIMRNDLTGTVSPSVIEHDIELRKEKEALTYRDLEPPPKQPAEKTKPVHNITKEHQEKVRALVNWAITSIANEDIAENGKLTKEEGQILTAALGKIIALRMSDIPDASDNLIYRDADHYLAARTQEWRTLGASKLENAGLITPEKAMKLALSSRSRENNEMAAGPLGANQLYETIKLREFQLEARSGQRPSNSAATSDKAPSAAGATEWKLLGMIDYERYDAGNDSRKAVPHLVLDLPGTGELYSTNPELPKYLRDDAKRISEKMKKEARFTK